MLTKDKLIEQIKSGYKPDYFLFWSGILSQWHPSPIQGVMKMPVRGFEFLKGYVCPTAEHWMMLKKAVLFDDREAALGITESEHPSEAKKWGRSVKNFDPTLWDKHKIEVVKEGNIEKFLQNPSLLSYLLDFTEGKVIVEASPYDKVWGIGISKDDPKAKKPSQWRGTNLLGFILMDVREELALALNYERA